MAVIAVILLLVAGFLWATSGSEEAPSPTAELILDQPLTSEEIKASDNDELPETVRDADEIRGMEKEAQKAAAAAWLNYLKSNCDGNLLFAGVAALQYARLIFAIYGYDRALNIIRRDICNHCDGEANEPIRKVIAAFLKIENLNCDGQLPQEHVDHRSPAYE